MFVWQPLMKAVCRDLNSGAGNMWPTNFLVALMLATGRYFASVFGRQGLLCNRTILPTYPGRVVAASRMSRVEEDFGCQPVWAVLFSFESLQRFDKIRFTSSEFSHLWVVRFRTSAAAAFCVSLLPVEVLKVFCQ